MRVVTAAQMRAADAAAVARDGDVVLMRRAGDALAEAIARVAPDARTIVAFAGPGNNGGDAFAALAIMPSTVTRIVYALDAPRESLGRRDAIERARVAGVLTRPFPHDAERARAAVADADLVIDAMLGVGARIDLDGAIRVVVDALAIGNVAVLAVDVPTGTDATSGAVGPRAIRARATVALGAPKLGSLVYPASAHVGDYYVGALDIDEDLAAVAGDAYAALDDAEFLALLPVRADESDKRRSGAPLVIAGSESFPGAAVLCARGAARAGAGYVTVGASAGEASILRAHLVEEVVIAYDDRDVAAAIDALLGLTSRCNAVAIGPGLGLSDRTGELVRGFLSRVTVPCVIDASALFHLSKRLDILRGKACVITPHAGEFARLSGEGTIAEGTRVARLRSFVARTGVTTLLKGSATLVDDGTTMHVNVTGTNALATAGTGDVLAGIIATLLAQGLSPVDAARAGAHWHGLAGRYAARERRLGVVAGDVADALGFALPRIERTTGRLARLIANEIRSNP